MAICRPLRQRVSTTKLGTWTHCPLGLVNQQFKADRPRLNMAVLVVRYASHQRFCQKIFGLSVSISMYSEFVLNALEQAAEHLV